MNRKGMLRVSQDLGGVEKGRLGRIGGGKGLLLNTAFLLGFGVFVPWWKGFDFLDAVVIALYACSSMLFVVPMVAGLLAADDGGSRSAAGLFGRISWAVLYGWGMVVVMLLLGLITVNVSNWHGRLVHPAWGVLAAALSLGLMASIFAAAVAALLTLLFSAGAARMCLRVFFFMLLLCVAFGGRIFPASIRDGFAELITDDGIRRLSLIASAVLLVLSGGLMAALRSAFVRK